MIKFECPHCQRKLNVKDELAGKKGKCPGCKKGVTIPVAVTTPATVPDSAPELLPQLPTPPRLDGPERSQEDLDREAMEALADEPPPEDAPPDEVTFECPMCGDKVTFKAELAGKRAPCPNPECRRIIQVPRIERKTPANWREVDRRPAAARQPLNTAPDAEGAVDSSNKRGISSETAQEFGLTRKKEKPVPTIEKVFPYLYYSFMGLVALLLLLGIWKRFYLGAERDLLATVTGFVGDKKTPPPKEQAAALYRGLAEYHFRRKQPDSAKLGREQCDAALGTLAQASPGSERDGLLLDVALTLLDYAGDKTDPAVERGEKIDWTAAQQGLTGAVRAMSTPDARREAVRLIGRRLAAANHPDLALALTGAALAAPAERADVQAVVGLELAEKHAAVAERAVDLALQPYTTKDGTPPPLSAAVVALAAVLKRPALAVPANKPLEAETAALGQLEALARDGKVDQARSRGAALGDSSQRFRAALALATVTADREDTDIETAARLLEGPLRGNPNVSSWSVYRLVELGQRANLPADRLREIAALANDPHVRARGALLVLSRELNGAKSVQPVPGPQGEKLDGLARLLVVELLCRHNLSQNSSWGNEVAEWKDAQKAFGSLGILQGRYPR